MRCASACPGRRCWRTGSTAIPRAVWFWDGIARPPHRSGCCSSTARFRKTYWAVVEGGPAEDEGTIDMPLGRLNAERGWWQKPDPDGQPAAPTGRCWGAAMAWRGSRWNPSPAARINCACTAPPRAGRSSATISTATARASASRSLHLHAREIVIPISKNKEPVRVAAPAPAASARTIEGVWLERRVT